jgi:hypothetical protein
MRVALVVCAVLGLTGCASAPEKVDVKLAASDYCQIARKISWRLQDTRQTIQEVRRHNAAWDRRCLAQSEKPVS